MKKQLAERKEFFTLNDINEKDNGFYNGKILVLNKHRVDEFPEKFRNPQNQLFVGVGGFGCKPTAIGTAVFGKFLSDGEECRLERYDFVGVLKNEVANELGYCPCGNELHESLSMNEAEGDMEYVLVMNSLSRKDNKTYICKECEGKELQEELEKLDLI